MNMYRVIEMYGDFEPWWFLEGWEEDIVASKKFDQYYDALKYYKNLLVLDWNRNLLFIKAEVI